MAYRFFTELAYRGTNYHGWQVQPNALSVQEVLNEAFSTILRQNIDIHGAGRTDTGVHASYFMAHFDYNNPTIDLSVLGRLNAFLPKDIVLRRIFRVHSEAHSRFHAVARSYRYQITRFKDPFGIDTAWHYTFPLNINKMNQSALYLFNYKDFTSFSKINTDTKTNDCQIYQAYWQEQDNKLVFSIKANRFLRNMVRAIVGTLIEIGREKLSTDEFIKVIEAKNRSLAGQSVPAHGLFLTDIQYPEWVYQVD